MFRLLLPFIAVALLGVAPATAQDDLKPRSQQDIIRERARACRGLKGQAMSDCQASYVGPRDEKAGTGGWRKPANPSRRPGRA